MTNSILPPHARFEPIHHTADVGYKLYADSLQELFVTAAAALFDAITELDSIQPQTSRRVAVTAADSEALLVTWLSELNYLCITELEVFCRFELDSFSETALSATIWGEPIALDRHEIKTEIKAVTYHGLYLRQSESGWEAQIIFDV